MRQDSNLYIPVDVHPGRNEGGSTRLLHRNLSHHFVMKAWAGLFSGVSLGMCVFLVPLACAGAQRSNRAVFLFHWKLTCKWQLMTCMRIFSASEEY